MKVLITGGCGFLGSNLALSWIEEGAEVVVVDALFRVGAEANLAWLKEKAKPRQLAFYKLDVAEADALETVFDQHGPFDYVCHLAGQVAMTTSLDNPRRDLLTNVVGTFNILEAIRGRSPDALLAFSSTNKVYGDLAHLRVQETATRYTLPDFQDGLDETTPLDFASPYGCSKGAADQYTRDWNRNFGVRTVVFRHSSIYGGRQFATSDQGWIGWFCKQALVQKAAFTDDLEPQAFSVSGTGKQVRDVLHASDLVNLYRMAYEKRDTIAGEIFNIGGGMPNSLSLLELFSFLEETLDLRPSRQLHYTKLPRRKSDQDVFVADIRKATNLLGWQPTLSYRNGIEMMLEWTLQNLQ